MPGEALLKLHVKARSALRLSEVFSLANDARIQSEAYDAVGVNHALQLNFTQKAFTPETGTAQVFAPMPNPTTGSTRMPIRLNIPETVSFEITDLSGKSLWHTVSVLETGAHFLEIPASALPQSGVYIWRVCAGTVTQSGRLLRI